MEEYFLDSLEVFKIEKDPFTWVDRQQNIHAQQIQLIFAQWSELDFKKAFKVTSNRRHRC